jgi:hypothetical protein
MYQLHVSLPTVRRWRERWLVLQAVALTDLDVAARLTDVPRPGRPIEIADTQVCQIVRMACEAPTESERPITEWTGREIADEAKRRGIVTDISPRHAARLVNRGSSAFDVALTMVAPTDDAAYNDVGLAMSHDQELLRWLKKFVTPFFNSLITILAGHGFCSTRVLS